jgi:hypothetical protein
MILLAEFTLTDSGTILFVIGEAIVFAKLIHKIVSDQTVMKNLIEENKRLSTSNYNNINSNSEKDRKDYEELKERSDTNDKEHREEIWKNRTEIEKIKVRNDIKDAK